MNQVTVTPSRSLTEVIESLAELANQGDPGLPEELRILLRDPYSAPTEEDRKRIKFHIETNPNVELRKAFGFFLFANAADRDDKAEANLLLADENTRNFVWEEYEVPQDYRRPDLRLHKIGTTSYILRILNNQVLKIIKYRYIDNQTISNTTANYMHRFPSDIDEQHTPYIYLSTKKFILMTFIPGASLREYMAELPYQDPELVITRIREVFRNLCLILGRFAQRGKTHLDLSPDNILIESQGEGQVGKVYLIDFGYNYVLREKVGSPLTFVSTETYLAPELLRNPEKILPDDAPVKFKILADIYSLGVILLEMLSKQALASQEISEELKPYTRTLLKQALLRQEIPKELEIHSARYTGVGQVLEELLDPNPDIRLFDAPKELEIYDWVKRRVDNELQIYAEMYLKKEPGWLAGILWLLDLIFPSTDQVKAGVKKLIILRRSGFEMSAIRRMNHILVWSLLALLLNTITVLAFTKLAIDDYNRHTVFTNLPGHLVAVSFSLVASKYYTSIFSTVFTQGIPTILAKTTEFFLRATSFIFVVPIWAAFYNPKSWPLCVALGSTYIIADNFFSYRLALRAKREAEKEFARPVPLSIKSFLDEFKVWYLLFAIYGLAFYGVWYLIHPNPIYELRDEWIYAILAIIINLKMMTTNCSGVEAERIRSGLERTIAAYLRALKYRDHKANATRGQSL